MNEADWTAQVLQLAAMFGWRWVHFRPAKTMHGWRTPVSGPLGEGWPDYVFVRPGRRIAAELKGDKGKPTDAQLAVLDDLKAAGFETFVWFPEDLEEVAAVLR